MSRPIAYSVVELFNSIQGEGRYSGTAAFFVRLAGCNLSCDFCDTDHRERERLTATEIAGEASRIGSKIAVITGGEPLMQDISPIVDALKAVGKRVHVETNGTYWNRRGADWVTCSPKREAAYQYECGADELKYVVDSGFSFGVIDSAFAGDIYLQPESNEPAAIRRIQHYILHEGGERCKLSLQLHKLTAMR
jgi:organic radical activating enzyme